MVKDHIQRGIIDLVKSSKFYKVSYDSNRKPNEIIENVTPFVESDKISVVVNEVESTFAENTRDGRKYSLLRSSWRFVAYLTFPCEVSFEAFERDLMLAPPSIPSVPEKNYPFVLLDIQKSSYGHPVQQQNATGSTATLVFGTRLGRV